MVEIYTKLYTSSSMTSQITQCNYSIFHPPSWIQTKEKADEKSVLDYKNPKSINSAYTTTY
jgi:hypothetical protein